VQFWLSSISYAVESSWARFPGIILGLVRRLAINHSHFDNQETHPRLPPNAISSKLTVESNTLCDILRYKGGRRDGRKVTLKML
jgi:hypothetical protein